VLLIGITSEQHSRFSPEVETMVHHLKCGCKYNYLYLILSVKINLFIE
jgi:hypothetical protein